MYKDLMTSCKAKEGATDADVQELASHQLGSTRTAQCLNACIMENIGFVRKIFNFSFRFFCLNFFDLDNRWQTIC